MFEFLGDYYMVLVIKDILALLFIMGLGILFILSKSIYALLLMLISSYVFVSLIKEYRYREMRALFCFQTIGFLPVNIYLVFVLGKMFHLKIFSLLERTLDYVAIWLELYSIQMIVFMLLGRFIFKRQIRIK